MRTFLCSLELVSAVRRHNTNGLAMQENPTVPQACWETVLHQGYFMISGITRLVFILQLLVCHYLHTELALKQLSLYVRSRVLHTGSSAELYVFCNTTGEQLKA